MPARPKEVFDDPDSHWAFLTTKSDEDFEGQFFDRKEAGRPGQHGTVPNLALESVREEISSTVSAFANRNVDGGLLVLGIAADGEVKGINHLSENQQNGLFNIAQLLKNNAAQVKVHDCKDGGGLHKLITLLFVPY